MLWRFGACGVITKPLEWFNMFAVKGGGGGGGVLQMLFKLF